MLIAKCHALAFHTTDGRLIKPARGSTLLHDPTGKSWPKTSCLITTFRKTGAAIEDPTDEEISWAKNPENVREGKVDIPPRTRGWKEIGRVFSIDYTRYGEHADWYEHEFKRPVRLLQRGKAMRLELGRGAEFNWRGFLVP
jgi:hypothetical protein